MPAVTTMPATIMIQVIDAAAARRSGATRVASSASSDVPAAPTPAPISEKATIDNANPQPDRTASRSSAWTASSEPSASVPIPNTIHGVRRRPRSEPCPHIGRDNCTA